MACLVSFAHGCTLHLSQNLRYTSPAAQAVLALSEPAQAFLRYARPLVSGAIVSIGTEVLRNVPPVIGLFPLGTS